MADHAPVMIWVTDPAGACTYVNERWCHFTGTSPERSFGIGWLDSVHPDDREKAGSAFRSANARNETFRVEYRLRRHDGAYRWVIDSAAPGSRRMAQYLGYIGSVLDVTERKRAEEELRRARDELDLRVRERTAALLGGARRPSRRQEGARKELLRRVVTVQEEERRRISRELHDQMGQHLTALMLGLRLAKDSAGEDSPLREPLRWLEDHAARIGREVHRIALELRPTALDDLGLPEALANYADEWSRRSGVAAELRVNGLERGAAAAARRDDDLPGRPGGADQRPEARRGDPRRRHPQPAEGFRLGHHRGRRQGLRRRGGDGIRLPEPGSACSA